VEGWAINGRIISRKDLLSIGLVGDVRLSLREGSCWRVLIGRWDVLLLLETGFYDFEGLESDAGDKAA
jgi:hypothetical protein